MLRFFKKKNESASSIADLTSGFYRIPFSELTPKEYAIPTKLFGFKKDLEAHMEKLFCGDIDEGNGNACDMIIDDELNLVKEDLKKQRASHIIFIKDLLRRWAGDYIEAEHRLEYVREEILKADEEIIRTQKLIDDHSVKEGSSAKKLAGE